MNNSTIIIAAIIIILYLFYKLVCFWYENQKLKYDQQIRTQSIHEINGYRAPHPTYNHASSFQQETPVNIHAQARKQEKGKTMNGWLILFLCFLLFVGISYLYNNSNMFSQTISNKEKILKASLMPQINKKNYNISPTKNKKKAKEEKLNNQQSDQVSSPKTYLNRDYFTIQIGAYATSKEAYEVKQILINLIMPKLKYFILNRKTYIKSILALFQVEEKWNFYKKKLLLYIQKHSSLLLRLNESKTKMHEDSKGQLMPD